MVNVRLMIPHAETIGFKSPDTGHAMIECVNRLHDAGITGFTLSRRCGFRYGSFQIVVRRNGKTVAEIEHWDF